MKNQLSAVLWDMDGVIVDSGDLHFEAWQNTLSAYGIPYNREFFDTTFGMNNTSMLKLLLGDEFTPSLFQKISDEKETLFLEMLPGRIMLLPGVQPLLESIQAANIPQAVASSAPMDNINATLDGLKLHDYFQAAISAFDIPGKPDPMVFLTAAEALHAPPYGCIVLEDSVAGVEAANSAGMKCIAVLTTNPPEKLQQADLVVPTLEDLSIETMAELLT